MESSINYLLNLLSRNDVVFYIPPYQRNYEWDKSHCSTFFDDVKKTTDENIAERNSEHFFGCITYFSTEDIFGKPRKLVLVDGQQRITSTMLFMIALRDVTNDLSLKETIETNFLKNGRASEEDTEYKIKLKQVESDWEVYRDLILQNTLSEKEKNSCIYINYKFFKDKLNSVQRNDPEYLWRLVDKGLVKFSVATIQLQPERNHWENPQEIFESMNSLGKPLSLADLVRNYLLMGLKPDIQIFYYNKYWLHMEKLLANQISNFIRDYMQGVDASSYPQATESNYKELYSKFKEMFNGHDVAGILNDFSKYSEIYAWIVLGSKSGNEKIDRYLADIREIGANGCYSFFIFLLQEWRDGNLTDFEAEEILHIFVIYFLRRRIVELTAPENKTLPTLTDKLPDILQEQDKPAYMYKLLASQEFNARIPNDYEVSKQMETMNFYNFRHSNFIFRMIEEKITKNRPSDKKLQIEHIMPQNLNTYWKNYLGEDCERIHQEYVNNIGNLTLIRHNQELGQKSFDEKKVIYANNSGLQIAQNNIIECDRWNEEAIISRQQWIIKYFLCEVIPLPDNMKVANNYSTRATRGLSFKELGLIGKQIQFIAKTDFSAKVNGNKTVEFEGKTYRLSPLTRELFTRMGRVNRSGSYQGARYWSFEGIRLSDLIE